MINFSFKKIVSVLLLVSIFSGCFHVFAAGGGSLAKKEEKIESIIRDETVEDDVEEIRCALNKGIKRCSLPIPGGGCFVFEPFEFHKDEARRICVYTIPYLLAPGFPVLEELKDMLWRSVSIITTSGDIGDGYMGRLQNLVDDFMKLFQTNAEFIDVGVAITKFLECHAESVCSNAEKVVAAKNKLKDFFSKFVNKLRDYKKPDKVSDQSIALDLLLKLFFCIEREEYRSSTGFHNVFVMAYDTGADDRGFFGKIFSQKRSYLGTCVAFTSVSGLDPSTAKGTYSFESQFSTLKSEIAQEVNKFLGYGTAVTLSQEVAEIKERQNQQGKVIDDHSERLRILERDVAQLKLEIEEHDKFAEFVEALRDCITGIAATGKVNCEEVEGALKKIEEEMRRCGASDETDRPDLSDVMRDTREHVIRHATDIIDLKREIKVIREQMKGVSERVSGASDLVAAINADKVKWTERALAIDGLAQKLRRDEDFLRQVSAESTEDVVWKLFEQSGYFGKRRFRKSFPFIVDREKKLKELSGKKPEK